MADGGSIFSDVLLCGGGARWGEAIKETPVVIEED
jgi:hypothetical protein